MTAFLIGDRVGWPARDGWHYGTVVARRPAYVKDGDGHALSLELTLYDEESHRTLTRPIRSCCALLSGPHVQKGEAA